LHPFLAGCFVLTSGTPKGASAIQADVYTQSAKSAPVEDKKLPKQSQIKGFDFSQW
jgi:hypothetical protein